MRTPDDIVALYHERLSKLGADHARMREVTEVYNNDVVLPLPELASNEQAAVANLTQQGLDQFARRVSSVLPTLDMPALDPGNKQSIRLSEDRKQIVHGLWEKSHLRRVESRRARWLLGYGQAPVVIRPDPSTECPVWDPVDPMHVYPSHLHLDAMTPADCIVHHKRDYGWLATNYPEALNLIKKQSGVKQGQEFECLEYIDSEQVTWVLLGHTDSQEMSYSSAGGADHAHMVTYPNRSGMCWVVLPQRITLDRNAGHFDSILGMYKTEAALMALEIIATRKAIYPTPWLVNPSNGAQPRVIQLPDAQTGEPGVITNGQIVHTPLDPSLRASTVRNDLQYAARQTAGLPSEFGGMSPTNVRTARRGSQVMGAAVDFTISDAQDLFAEALHEETKRAIAIDKGYFDVTKKFYVSTKGVRGMVEYKPSDTFEENAQFVVSYPVSGYDISDLVINGGQRVAQRTLSRRGFMKIDPMVDDDAAMENEVRLEATEDSFFEAFRQMAAAPDSPWQAEHIADFAARLARGEKWYEAVDEINQQLKEQQAAGAPAGSPETQPGLSVPGAPGAEVPAIGEPTPSLGNMAQMLSQIGVTDQALRHR